ncbi:GtrA/DPMS transmembrane domain-containing protein [Candidatus Electrothrix laxa]
MRLNRSNINQFIRYGAVGAFLNLFGFLIYLLVTWLGMEPKLAVTVFYPLGVLYGYFTHKRVSFRHAGSLRDIWPMVRYIFVYALGYVLNVGFIYLFHDRFGYPHQWVQVVAIFVVSGFLFVGLKLFVFRVAATPKTVKP